MNAIQRIAATKVFCLVMGVAALAARPGTASAQTLTVLHSFGANPQDGQKPGVGAPLTAVGSTLYGTTTAGGTNNSHGIIFAINIDGSGYTNLHQFGATGDGSWPQASLTQAGSTLFGTTSQGGTNNSAGTVYAINTDGSGYTILHEFGATGDASGPGAGLTLVGATLYSTTRSSSVNGYGTIFTINTNGSDYAILYQFGTNVVNDGQQIFDTLTLAGSTLYGTTYYGGAHMDGTVFAIDTNGSDYAILYPLGARGADGQNPEAALTLVGSTLFGTTFYGGGVGHGTIFSINANGSGFTNLYQFTTTNYYDAFYPAASLTLLGSTLYGTTYGGGTNGSDGDIIAISTNGTDYGIIYRFGAGGVNDGSSPEAALTLVDSNFYGTTYAGGVNGAGTVFKFEPPAVASCTYSISPTNATVAAAGDSGTVNVTASSGCAWTAASNNPFITISAGASGSGNGTVHYSVAANAGTNDQTGTLTIAGQTFSVTQSGPTGASCSFTLSATSVTLTAKGGAKTVSLKTKGTDCSWTAVSHAPFITITSGENGTGSGKVGYSVAGNTNTIAVSGTLTIAGETFTVQQAGGTGCSYSLSPKDAKPKATGGPATVKVKANLSDCAWTAVSNDPFIEITDGANGVGSGTVSYMVAPNTNTTAVTGSITIGGEMFPITQAAAR